MICHRPTTTDSLLKVDGVSERQCERFGEQLVNCVATFCKENELNADMFKGQTDSVNVTNTKVIFFVLCVWLSFCHWLSQWDVQTVPCSD